MDETTDILSPQQRTIMQHIVDGYSIKDIARIMEIKKGTIKTYLLRVRVKTNSKSMYQCVAILVSMGVVMPSKTEESR